jgi:hypothetical protein
MAKKHVFYGHDLVGGLLGSFTEGVREVSADEFEFIASVEADDIFRVMNVVTGDPEVEIPMKLGCRSMSCGDLYVEDGVAFLCEAIGWTRIEDKAFVDALLAKVTS